MPVIQVFVMAFASKIGNLLKQTVSRHVGSGTSSPSNPSLFQALRYMSSSKLFVGGAHSSLFCTSIKFNVDSYQIRYLCASS